MSTIDPTRSHGRLVFADAPAEPLGAPGEGWPLVERLLDRAAVLVAFEQVGGAQAALDMARDYAVGRFAFGRPIASFQAIKHKLADMYVGVELARSNAYYGAWSLSKDAPELPVAAAAARVAATEAYFHAAKENIQTHGGMGFTWQVDCHLFYRRAQQLGLVAGGSKAWKERLVSQLGSELFILEQAPLDDLRKAGSPLLAEGIARMREGRTHADDWTLACAMYRS